MSVSCTAVRITYQIEMACSDKLLCATMVEKDKDEKTHKISLGGRKHPCHRVSSRGRMLDLQERMIIFQLLPGLAMYS